MTTVEIVLLIVAALAGAYAALQNDARIAGLGVVLVALAVLLTKVG
jgi:hypothetical protein